MKLPTQTRIDLLVDAGSFEPLAPSANATCVTGMARISGRRVCLSVTRHEPGPPSDGIVTLEKWNAIAEAAGAARCPLVTLLDAPGQGHTLRGESPIPRDSARLLAHKRGSGGYYAALARLSGQVPRVVALLGETGSSTVFPVALCDAAVMVEGSGVCIGRPDAVKSMVGEDVDFQTLGGARLHCTVTGLGDALLASEEQVLSWVKRYLSFVPENRETPPHRGPPLPPATAMVPDESLVPADPDRPFAIHPLLQRVVDEGSLLELKELYAREVVTAFCRVEGRVAGLVANNSKVRGGILFPESCAKMSRFVSLCDAFGIPIIFVADTPGFMIGTAVERAGIIGSASLLFSTIARCTVPRLCVIARKAHSAGLYAMGGPGFDPVEVIALPGATVSVYGRRALMRFAGSRELSERDSRAFEEMLSTFGHPEILVGQGLMNAVVPVHRLRARISAFLERSELEALTARPNEREGTGAEAQT